MKDLTGRTDRKGGRFFLMEGTETFQVLAGPSQAYVMSDYLGDIGPISDLIDHVFRNQTSAHGSRGSYFPHLAPVRKINVSGRKIDRII
jgi:hypothetical protein